MSRSSGMGGSSGSTSGGGRSYKGRSMGPNCKCGRPCLVYTSKTQRNPNREFFGCPYFKEKKPYCSYFQWVDDAGSLSMDEDCTEMDHKLKYVEMKMQAAEMEVHEQQLKICDLERKIKELSLKMESELGRMGNDVRVVGMSVRLLAGFVGVMVFIFLRM